MAAYRAAVLISGNGSNLQALIDARLSGRLDLEIVKVISDSCSARGLQRAENAGIPSAIIENNACSNRDEFDRALSLVIGAGDPELVILAGFMRILGAEVLGRFDGRMINLHPSLLPLYRGVDTYQRALDAGDSEHGASIHFVTGELDGGPVISQARIPVLKGDDAVDLASRLGPVEHSLLVSTVELFTRCTVKCSNDSVLVDNKILTKPLLLQSDGTFL
jgi:phosphoribosylglycinamide formyltransferase-1